MAEPELVKESSADSRGLKTFPCGHLSVARLDGTVCGLCYDLHESAVAARIRSDTLRVRLVPGQPYFGQTTVLRFDCYNRIGKHQHRCCQGFYLSLEDANKCIDASGTPILCNTILDCKTCHQSNQFPLYKVLLAMDVIYHRQFNVPIGPLDYSVGYDPKFRMIIVVESSDCSLIDVQTAVKAQMKPGDLPYNYLCFSHNEINKIWQCDETGIPKLATLHKHIARFPDLIDYLIDHPALPPIATDDAFAAIMHAKGSLERNILLQPFCIFFRNDKQYSGDTVSSPHIEAIDKVVGGPSMTEILARENRLMKPKSLEQPKNRYYDEW